jgi:hypothetical protein
MVLCHVAARLPFERVDSSPPKSPTGSVARLIRFDPRGSVITCALSHIYNTLLFSSDHALKQECCLALTALAEAGVLDASTIVTTGAVSSITAGLRYESPSSSEAAVVALAHLCNNWCVESSCCDARLCWSSSLSTCVFSFGSSDVVDEMVAAGGCTGIALLLQRLVTAAILPPIACYFTLDCLVRMALARPRVVGNLVGAGVVDGVANLLERLLRARPGLGAYTPTFVDIALENSRLVTILLSAVGNLALNNPVAGAKFAEAGSVAIIALIVRAQGPKGDAGWESMFTQAEFALRACVPPPRETLREPVSKRTVVL